MITINEMELCVRLNEVMKAYRLINRGDRISLEIGKAMLARIDREALDRLIVSAAAPIINRQ
jgi:hypothetical protein